VPYVPGDEREMFDGGSTDMTIADATVDQVFESIVRVAPGTSLREDRRSDDVVIVRPETDTLSKQRLPYFVGISGSSAGSTRISMNLVVIPPAGAAEPHSHRGYETAVYIMKGKVDVRYGHALERLTTIEQGDFLFIPADLPHQPINRNPTEPALCIVARNDANEQESVEIFGH
jgi:uncharacterized RmlC-like cupin family protein